MVEIVLCDGDGGREGEDEGEECEPDDGDDVEGF